MWNEDKTHILDRLLATYVGRVYTAAVLHIRQRGRVVYERAVGQTNPQVSPALAHRHTLFDLASLTKLFTATTVLALVHQYREAFPQGVDTRVAHLIPEFRGERPIRAYEDPLHPGEWVTVTEKAGTVNAGEITVRDLLSHRSGLPAWRPLYQWPREHIRERVLHTFFSYPPRTRVVYSDIGFILLGWIVEKVTAMRLDEAIRRWVFTPLHLSHTAYRPLGEVAPPREDEVAATEFCAWRGRRMWGEVHDENAWALGGIAGHAGIFSTAEDVGTFGQAWLDVLRGQSPLPLPPSLAREAVSLQAEEGHTRRGLGWALRSTDPQAFTSPLSPRSFGHTGFTGTSLHVDPTTETVIVCLTNRVYYGRDPQGIMEFRGHVYRAVAQ